MINSERHSLNLRALAGLAETARRLRDARYDVIVVSSGAVCAGCQCLGLVSKPSDVPKRQALASVGQVHLMRYYEDLFKAAGLVGVLPAVLP